MPVFSEGSHFLVWGQGEKGRSGEPVGLPRWESVLTGSGVYTLLRISHVWWF